MYRWTDSSHQIVERVADSTFIPADEGNRDWRDFLAWCEAGGVPLDPEPQP